MYDGLLTPDSCPDGEFTQYLSGNTKIGYLVLVHQKAFSFWELCPQTP